MTGLSQRLFSAILASSLSLVATCSMQAQSTSQTASDTTSLKFALVFSRHGVRPPTKTNDAYNSYALQDFPDWSVPAGYLTVHGAQLMNIMGGYYRQYFIQQNLLTGNDAADRASEYVYADNSERTYATAQALAAGLLPSVTPAVNELANGATDPLFYPVKLNIGSPDPATATAALSGRIGSNPAALAQNYKSQLNEMESILLNRPITGPVDVPSWRTSILTTPAVSVGAVGSLVNFTGSVDTASTLAEIFILEYCDGKDPGQIAWGRASEDQIIDMAKLHTADFDLLDRTPYLAQALGSNLLLHIVNTLNQAATGATTARSLGNPGQKLVVLVGHDNQLAAVGGLLRADWQLPTFAFDDTPPGGAMVFELRQDNATGAYVVRTYYTAATMDQQHDATPLSLQTPPGVAPIFIPNASTSGAFFDAPLSTFTSVAMGQLNPSYTN